MMNIRNQSRTFRKNAHNIWRVYKFDSEYELSHFNRTMQSSFFNDCVKVLSDGIVFADTIDYLQSMSDDDSWKELMIKCGSIIAITKEDLFGKEAALKKFNDFQKKLLKTNKMENTENKVSDQTDNQAKNESNYNKIWSKEELDLLWSGSLKEVAETLGRTAAAVSYQRAHFLNSNPDFKPPVSKRGRKPGTRNRIVSYKEQRTAAELSQENRFTPKETKTEMIPDIVIVTEPAPEQAKMTKPLDDVMNHKMDAVVYMTNLRKIYEEKINTIDKSIELLKSL